MRTWEDGPLSELLWGPRIRDFRTLYGLTQVDLAKELEVSQTTLSMAEREEIPADDVIELIVDAYDVPFAFFVERAATAGADGTLRFRKRARTSKKDTDRVAVLFKEAHRVAARLASTTGVRAPDFDGLRGLPVEEAAARARIRLGVPDGAAVDHMIRRCEAAGIAVFPLRLLGFNPDQDVVGHSGVSAWEPWDVPAIGYMPGEPGDRQRHTVAHELGHLILHRGRGPVLSRDDQRQSETQASTFASAFLVPPGPLRAAMRTDLTLSEFKILKAGWGVSIASLIMRSRDLGFIDDDRATSLFKQLSARGWRKEEPVSVTQEHPVLMARMLARLAPRGDTDLAASTLGLGGTVLGSLTYGGISE